MTQIWIARHGQSEDNANGRLNGRRDLPLTELGRRQARELGESIKAAGYHFDVVYASPLQRARQTAEIVAQVAGLPAPIEYAGIIERNLGVMEGQPLERIPELCMPDTLETKTATYFLHCDGAETFDEMVERGHETLRDMRQRHPGKSVLLVCHGDIGQMLYAADTGKNWRDVLREFHFGNGDLIETSGDGDAHKIKLPELHH